MSNTAQILDVIMHEPPRNRCCKKAFMQGMLAAKGTVEDGGVLLHLNGDKKLAFACATIAEVYSTNAQIVKRAHSGIGKTILLNNASALKYIADISNNKPLIREKCPQCMCWFLRGMFVSCARLSDVSKEYRLEFSIKDRAEILQAFLSEIEVKVSVIHRRNESLLLIKNSSHIEEFFVLMGINKIAFDIMNARIENELKSEIQRITNFETANIGRAVQARDAQISLLKALKERNLFSSLPQELAQTAELRLQYPEASLTQLASLCVPALTKSGITMQI